MKRRFFIKSALLLLASTQGFASSIFKNISAVAGNFKYVYSSSSLKINFYNFLKNVFNLYPEDELHALINETTLSLSSDKDIYKEAQLKLDDISPFFSIFKYQLPSLLKQKNEMAKQTVQLLGEGTSYNGYLEIGSSGRYLDYLEEKVKITGNRFYADGKEPGYGVTEMIDRGQIAVGAEYIPLANYQTRYADLINPNTLDLVTVYIGFHHCPKHLRIPFISSIRDTMRLGGKLILRDHDCDSEDQKAIVGLAHDVFNMGTNESWDYNAKELRNFYSLDFICDFVVKVGFEFNEKTLFQEGDPTKNALMIFTKI